MHLQCRKSVNAVLLVLTTLSCVSVAQLASECIFGLNNLSRLTSRNDGILSIMNETLFNYTSAAETVISNGSNFNLTAYLSRNHAIDSDNFLTFVSAGKMMKINWTLATKSVTVNQTFDGLKFDSYISQRFVQPVHTALQNLSEMLSFSTGIFRPHEIQFHYTGFTIDSAGDYILDTSCNAGVVFVWRLCTDIPYNTAFLEHSSPEFANLAVTIEKAMDDYYRSKTALSDEFVRANLRDVAKRLDGTPYTVVYVEVYFRNASLNESTVASLTVLGQLNIAYKEVGSLLSKPVVLCGPTSTRINSTFYAPVISSTGSVLHPSTHQSTLSSVIYTEPTTVSSPSTLTTQMSTTGLPATSNSDFTITATNGNNVSVTMSSPILTSVSDNSTTRNAMLPAQSFSSDAINATSTMPVSNNWSSLTTQNINSTTSTATNMAVTFNRPTNYSTTYGSAIYVTINNSWSSNVTPITEKGVTALNIANMTAVTKATFRVNASTSLTTPTTSNGSNNSNGKTTYDPDPFFKAQVEVVTKVYNDDYLLRMKIVTMKPLTETKRFLMVTIPALVGMLALFFCCLVSWQKDCYPQDKKLRAV